MRNQNSKVRTTKRKLSKCEGVCRTYSALQYVYADILEKDDSVVSFRCNVILTDFEVDGSYTTGFVAINGKVLSNRTTWDVVLWTTAKRLV